jgi:hypothetical protein
MIGLLVCLILQDPPPGTLRGEVVDAASGRPIAARVYLQGPDSAWHHVGTQDPAGSAVPYVKQSFADAGSIEIHTAVSAHPFAALLTPGRYRLTVERGKDYLSESREVDLPAKGASVRIALRRWADPAAEGWYSGETHVHRSMEELPTLLLAEDLNVAFPLPHWVREAFTAPGAQGAPEAKLREIDPTHVIWPRNTEYEIFTVGGKRHTLGAFFVIGHRSLLDLGVPPVRPVGDRARGEGALLELDKHNWPWSMMLMPALGVDLFELSNNHLWRAAFAFRNFAEAPPDSWNIERDGGGMSERGWIEFGFRAYYALLDCGFRMKPTAGTASGVHPVPLGFGRVYVRTPDGFSYDAWMNGLREGRSFVTTGPLLRVTADDRDPGRVFEGAGKRRLRGVAESAVPLRSIEIVGDGGAVRALRPENRPKAGGGFESPVDETVDVSSTGWFALRCFEERPDGRPRFAHSAPWHVEVPGKPLLPRRADVGYFAARVEAELKRNERLLPEAALAEFREALAFYRKKLAEAR